MSQLFKSAALPLILLFGANTAVAATRIGPYGEDVRNWMELQRSGDAASTTRQSISGPVADAIYKRYVESFKHPIPESYSSQQNGKSGGSK
ncbi:MAG: DUF3613 domain-containing protein [Gammaproteobacteria bacterium]